MIKYYRKKPVVIEAIIWTGDNLKEVTEFTGLHPNWSKWFSSMEDYEDHIKKEGNIYKIITLEGTFKVEVGDYIIKGVQGEFYSCKPDIFHMTYEEVDIL